MFIYISSPNNESIILLVFDSTAVLLFKGTYIPLYRETFLNVPLQSSK